MPILHMPLGRKTKQSWLHQSGKLFCIYGITFFKDGNMLFEKKDHKVWIDTAHAKKKYFIASLE